MHVIVVGAGLAGLSAAKTLIEEGIGVTLVEGRDRIGGRVNTEWDAQLGIPVELGPEWFERKGPVGKLVKSCGAHAIESSGSRMMATDSEWLNLDDLPDTNRDLLRRMRKELDVDTSLDSAMAACCDASSELNAMNQLREYVAGFHAADPSRVSVRWLLEAEKKQPADKSAHRSSTGLRRTTDALCARIESTCQVMLSTIVSEITWKPGDVRVHTDAAGLLRADAAVIAVPHAVLTSDRTHHTHVRFAPALRSRNAAMAKLCTGEVRKIILTFREPFWNDIPALRDASFLHAFGQPFPSFWFAPQRETAALIAWAGGTQASPLANADYETVIDLALTSLACALHTPKQTIQTQLTASYHHNWQSDAFALGAYTYATAGGADVFDMLAEPVEDTLFFAGEYTRGDARNATMEGAIESGELAAARVASVARR